MGVIYYLGKEIIGGGLKSIKDRFAHDRKFDSSLWEKSKAQYQNKIKISPENFNFSAFDEYMESRTKNMDGFAKLTDADGKEIGKKLKENETITNAIKVAFKLTEELKKAKEQNESSINQFKKRTSEIGEKYSVSSLTDSFKKINFKAKNALTAQQKHESKKLQELLNKDEFSNSIKDTLGKDTDIKAIKENMTKHLDKKHETERNELYKKIANNENQVDRASTRELAQTMFINFMKEKYSSSMKRKIEEAQKKKRAEEKRAEEINSSISIGEDHFNLTISSDDVSNIDLDDLELETIRGRKIDRLPDGKTLRISFGNRWNPKEWGTYLDPFNSIKGEVRSLVEAVRATGAKAITMNVQFSDPEIAKLRAKQALEASLEAGYPVENITIVMNGKTYKMEKGKAEGNPFEDFMSAKELEKYKIKQKSAASRYDFNKSQKGTKDYKKQYKTMVNKAPKKANYVPLEEEEGPSPS